MKTEREIRFAGPIAYTLSGNEDSSLPPLVLLHGLCEDHTVWSPLLPALEGYGRLFCVDLPGFGASALPSEADLSGYAQAISAFMGAIGVRRAVVAGHSLGGYVVLQLLADGAANLAGAVLVHSHPFADSPERLRERLRSIEMLESGHKELFVRPLFERLFAPHFAQAHPDIVEECVQMGLRQPTTGIIAAIKAIMQRTDRTEALRQSPCPVMAVLGDEDRLVPPEATRQAVELAPQNRVHVLHGVGHVGMLEATEELARCLLDFWMGLGPAR